MSEYEIEMLQTVRKISELLELLAEEKIAHRDAKQRVMLREIVGGSKPKQESVFLMNGTRTQAEIHSETGFHNGRLGAMIGQLDDAKLLVGNIKKTHLAISIPPTFFDAETE